MLVPGGGIASLAAQAGAHVDVLAPRVRRVPVRFPRTRHHTKKTRDYSFFVWCREGESNPHARFTGQRILSPVRLPIPPPRRGTVLPHPRVLVSFWKRSERRNGMRGDSWDICQWSASWVR